VSRDAYFPHSKVCNSPSPFLAFLRVFRTTTLPLSAKCPHSAPLFPFKGEIYISTRFPCLPLFPRVPPFPCFFFKFKSSPFGGEPFSLHLCFFSCHRLCSFLPEIQKAFSRPPGPTCGIFLLRVFLRARTSSPALFSFFLLSDLLSSLLKSAFKSLLFVGCMSLQFASLTRGGKSLARAAFSIPFKDFLFNFAFFLLS